VGDSEVSVDENKDDPVLKKAIAFKRNSHVCKIIQADDDSW
jgi:hypothetical protein